MLIWLLIDAIICGAVGAMITSARGGGATIGALVGAVFGPLGVIASFAFTGKSSEPAPPPSHDMRDCPFCAEPIRKAAIKCRYCGSDIAAQADDPISAVATPDEMASPGSPPNAAEGDKVILMLVLAIAVFVAILVIAGGGF